MCIKKRSLLRQLSREALLVRRPKSVKTVRPGKDTVKGYKYRFLFIFFLTACFTSVLDFITNSYCVSCCLLACVFDSVLFLGLLINYCRLICYIL